MLSKKLRTSVKDMWFKSFKGKNLAKLSVTDKINHYEEVWKLRVLFERELLEKEIAKLDNLNLTESKKLLTDIMHHSYITIKNLYFYTQDGGDNKVLSYVNAVNVMIADMLHNAPHMIFDNYFPDNSEEFYLRKVKSTIAEYAVFIRVLKQYLEMLEDSEAKKMLLWYRVFDFELVRYISATRKVEGNVL